MPRYPDPLSVPYEDAAIGLVERAIQRADNPLLRPLARWQRGVISAQPGVDWERLALAFDRALYRSPQVYHRSPSKTHSLKKPVWSAPAAGRREVRIRVFPLRQAVAYLRDHPGAGMNL